MNTKTPPQIILGIDTGSRKMGFGVIGVTHDSFTHMDSGVILIPLNQIDYYELDDLGEPLDKGVQFSNRLAFIYKKIAELVLKYKPDHFAIEDVFVNKNASSALKLGQAKGSAVVAAANHEIPISEYAPRVIKQSVVGKGSADKYQVQQMVRILLNLTYLPKPDEADALAVAICHANSSLLNKYKSEQYPTLSSRPRSKKFSRGRIR